MYIKTRAGKEIRIIEGSANDYLHIGTILLDDSHGNAVKTIENNERGKSEEIITQIYKKWMNEAKNCSWIILTECFRACRLNRLAADIEEHLGLSSPQDIQRGALCKYLLQSALKFISSSSSCHSSSLAKITYMLRIC